MKSNTMAKPVGGRGQKAPKPTTMRRIPEGIKEAVEFLSELYRDDEWDGTVEGLKLISGNKQKSLIPDIKNQLAELNDLRDWKHRVEKQLSEVSDLRENLTQLQKANIQADKDLAKAVAMKCQFEDEAKKLRVERDELDRENSQLHEKNGDLGLQVQQLQEQIAILKSDTGRNKSSLQEIQHRFLQSLKLGKQSPEYKRTKTAVEKFVEFLKTI